MPTIKFRVNGKPVGKARPRFARFGNFVKTYTDKKTKDAEQSFLAQALPYKPETPIKGAIKLTLTFNYIKPKGKYKSIKYWVTKPDIDNLNKLASDSLNNVFWNDDNQVIEINSKKVYNTENYTEVMIEELE